MVLLPRSDGDIVRFEAARRALQAPWWAEHRTQDESRLGSSMGGLSPRCGKATRREALTIEP